MSGLFVAVSPEVAAFVVRALRRETRELRRDMRFPPAGAFDLEQAFLAVARTAAASSGLERTSLAPDPAAADHDRMTLLLDYDRVAEALDVSDRQVRRLVASGGLPVVEIGGAKRIHRDDLERFVNEHRTRRGSAA